MFEKEAEEIMMQKVIKENDCIMTTCKTLEDCQLLDFCFDDMVDAFKDGAEFGYNKANEELEEKYKETICNSELNLASITEQLEELEKANEENEGKCKTAYIKGIRTMANALKDYDRTEGVWTDYFEHTVEEVLKRLLKESK